MRGSALSDTTKKIILLTTAIVVTLGVDTKMALDPAITRIQEQLKAGLEGGR